MIHNYRFFVIYLHMDWQCMFGISNQVLDHVGYLTQNKYYASGRDLTDDFSKQESLRTESVRITKHSDITPHLLDCFLEHTTQPTPSFTYFQKLSCVLSSTSPVPFISSSSSSLIVQN